MENIGKHMENLYRKTYGKSMGNIGKHIAFLWKLRKTYGKTMENIGKHMENLWK